MGGSVPFANVILKKANTLSMQACHQAINGEIIAIDGKTARGSYDKGKDKDAIHMVIA